MALQRQAAFDCFCNLTCEVEAVSTTERVDSGKNGIFRDSVAF